MRDSVFFLCYQYVIGFCEGRVKVLQSGFGQNLYIHLHKSAQVVWSEKDSYEGP